MATSPLASNFAWAQQNIGNAQVVVNDVRGVIGKAEPETLRAGIDVLQNEIIRTGDKSASKVLFQDNTTLSVGPSSEVTLDRFVFDPDPQKSQVALSIAKGVVRFATGSLPKSAYKISTPTATIGVRGTILSVIVGDDGATTVSVEEGAALVSAAGATVTVDTGLTTGATAGAPPATPAPSPPSPSPQVAEMDDLLSPVLKPGRAAGLAAARFLVRDTVIGAGIAGGLAVLLIDLTKGGHTTTTTATSH